MSMMESVAYLKGLAKGLEIDQTSKEGKLLTAIVDVLDEMAVSINDVEETCGEFDELIDIIDEDLGNLESDFYGDDDDDEDDDENPIYEVTCPNCNECVCLDEDTLFDGEMACPNCGQKLEFDTDCDCEDDDCCCHHGDDE